MIKNELNLDILEKKVNEVIKKHIQKTDVYDFDKSKIQQKTIEKEILRSAIPYIDNMRFMMDGPSMLSEKAYFYNTMERTEQYIPHHYTFIKNANDEYKLEYMQFNKRIGNNRIELKLSQKGNKEEIDLVISNLSIKDVQVYNYVTFKYKNLKHHTVFDSMQQSLCEAQDTFETKNALKLSDSVFESFFILTQLMKLKNLDVRNQIIENTLYNQPILSNLDTKDLELVKQHFNCDLAPLAHFIGQDVLSEDHKIKKI